MNKTELVAAVAAKAVSGRNKFNIVSTIIL